MSMISGPIIHSLSVDVYVLPCIAVILSNNVHVYFWFIGMRGMTNQEQMN